MFTITPRSFFLASFALVGGLLSCPLHAGETLYNGIVLPDAWPQKAHIGREPLAVPPYLTSPPPVIPIDVGRQLFVDNFLIEQTTLARTDHHPDYFPSNPVLVPDRDWDKTWAAPFSDGIWYDSNDQLFKMFYWAHGSIDGTSANSTCLATSHDGIHWEKPKLDVIPGTNIVFRDEPKDTRNSSTVWLDVNEKDPTRRFKMFRVMALKEPVNGKLRGVNRIRAGVSPDGIHWTTVDNSDTTDDRTTVFYNPFRNVWVASLRYRNGDGKISGRFRRYHEGKDFLAMLHWTQPDSTETDVDWVGADGLDADRKDLVMDHPADRPFDTLPSQLYNLDCVGYESVLLGCFSVWRGQPVRPRPKINEVCVGYSRDGFNWSRPDRQAFCPVSEDKTAWNWGNLQSIGGCCLVAGDKLYFYVGAAAGTHTIRDPSNVGMAILRRDGFTSMDAAETEGQLQTRPLTFKGKYLFANLNAPSGHLAAEILDEKGNVIPQFSREKCSAITGDTTATQITWQGAPDLSSLSGKVVKFRFYLQNGSLYSFWVTPDASGASHGYIGAGGPGYVGQMDTVGTAALKDAHPGTPLANQ